MEGPDGLGEGGLHSLIEAQGSVQQPVGDPGGGAPPGSFEYTGSEGAEEAIFNPQDNSCYRIDASGRAVNGTDRDAIVFSGERCRGSHVELAPGQVELAAERAEREVPPLTH